jgi:glycosyltransferase involved in cell wall biosynthesis
MGVGLSLPESDNGPLVSAIVPCVNGLPIVAECVESFLAQSQAGAIEVVVVDRCGPQTRAELVRRFPQARVIAVETSASIPSMRARGIEQARGRVIAITEDHCLAEPGWLAAVERAYRAGYEAVGGPVENGCTARGVDWAVFFCEYVRFMGPLPTGVCQEIAGNNSAYDRRLLERLRPELQQERWESFLHARMRELGVVFYCDPEMAVLHKKSFGYRYFLSQRYHYSRSFAGMRLTGARRWRRWVYAAGTLLLPGLLLARIGAAVARKRRHGRAFVLCLPILATFLVSWAVGEGVGALLGPGKSLERVE